LLGNHTGPRPVQVEIKFVLAFARHGMNDKPLHRLQCASQWSARNRRRARVVVRASATIADADASANPSVDQRIEAAEMSVNFVCQAV
jgi:hypothetical protein